ncbi:phage tail protein [Tenacibaculum finnmarkense]|uniref:phage tail protein n=1 Tax=Tenacibaculum finnmarkense TaxID=2781243 RepID=UPI00187B7932|nr:tail fiber protein [Tenacibaculum finnmarkense]MBE7691391.1 phage tail protein [Tenacibaculum finnmarkense genomovar finnmarkense]
MKKKLLFFAMLLICLLSNIESNAQDTALIAEIKLFAGNFAPRGWAFCDGQLLAISQNQALFSLLGTTYGGDGRTTFGLPDLRGRVAIGPRNGPGLSNYRLGQKGGAQTVTLNTTNLPNHTHTATFTQTSGTSTIPAVAEEANSDEPTNNKLAIPNIGGANKIYSNATTDTSLTDSTATVTGNVQIGATGGQQAFENRQPYIALNYIIAIEGVFPSRN